MHTKGKGVVAILRIFATSKSDDVAMVDWHDLRLVRPLPTHEMLIIGKGESIPAHGVQKELAVGVAVHFGLLARDLRLGLTLTSALGILQQQRMNLNTTQSCFTSAEAALPTCSIAERSVGSCAVRVQSS